MALPVRLWRRGVSACLGAEKWAHQVVRLPQGPASVLSGCLRGQPWFLGEPLVRKFPGEHTRHYRVPMTALPSLGDHFHGGWVVSALPAVWDDGARVLVNYGRFRRWVPVRAQGARS